jgi:hypothetical protein
MEKSLRQRMIGVWIAADAVFVSAFLPWGTIVAKPTFSDSSFPFSGSRFGDMTMKFTLTGWSGTMTFLGVSVPNWFTVVLAFAAAGFASLGAAGIWNPPRLLPLVLAGLGLAQVLGTVAVLGVSSGGSLGIGVLAALASFVWLVMGCLRLMRHEVVPSS